MTTRNRREDPDNAVRRLPNPNDSQWKTFMKAEHSKPRQSLRQSYDDPGRSMMLWKVPQVAERLNCSPSTVYCLIESGELEHHRCPGIRVSETQLLAYLERTKQGRSPEPKRPKATRPRLKHITLN